MKPTTVTVAAVTAGETTAASNWIVLDRFGEDFKVSLAVVVSGTATYSVQHTFQDVGLNGTSGASVFNHDTLVSGTSSDDGNYAYPVAATRLLVTPVTGASGTVTFTVTQAGC